MLGVEAIALYQVRELFHGNQDEWVRSPNAQVTGINSPGYTPPEQINYQAVPQSDFFALGRTFIYLLTGKQPTDPDIYDAHNDELRWHSYAPHISPQLADFIDQMMARLPSQRPANTQVILQKLADIERVLSSPKPSSQPPVSPPVTPSQGWTRRRFAKYLGFGSVGVTTAGLIYVLFPKNKSTLTVSQLGNGDYKTISEAIKNASLGMRILVHPGFYKESIIINKPLEIIGDGSKADIIIESTDSNCILMQTDHAIVSGLTLRGRARLKKDKYSTVDIPQGELVLADCDVTSDSLACVTIYGSTANPVLRNCQFHDSNHSGIFVYENGQGTVENCDIFGNTLSGVEIKKGGNPVVRQCRIHDGKASGIFVYENGQGTVENCDIFGNALAGVSIQEGGNPLIRHCKIHNGKAGGILVHMNGQGRMEDCEIFNNAYSGVEIRGGGNPILRQCKINQNKESGVYVHDKGEGTVENCNLTSNVGSAFKIDTTSQVQRNGNTE